MPFYESRKSKLKKDIENKKILDKDNSPSR